MAKHSRWILEAEGRMTQCFDDRGRRFARSTVLKGPGPLRSVTQRKKPPSATGP